MLRKCIHILRYYFIVILYRYNFFFHNLNFREDKQKKIQHLDNSKRFYDF